MNDTLLIFLSTIFFFLLMYLIRGLILWYYQITKRVILMEETNKLLRQILENQKSNSNG